ncbi:MAG: hypothetical protein U0931_15050 [Vulcanimicrobiota bacterium]
MEPSKKGVSASRQQPCPICQKPDWCVLFPDGGVNCYRAAGEVERTDEHGAVYWVHSANGARSFEAPAPQARPRPADAGQLDRAYRELQQQFSLSKADEDQLKARGLSELAIREYGFRSVPQSNPVRANVAEHIARLFPFWASVPGMVDQKGKPRLAASQGLCIFGKDLAGRINGVRLRLDSTDGSRYVWLSSAKQNGPSAGAPPSFWKPISRRSEDDIVRVTEGQFKAGVAAELTGIPGIASGSGVGTMASPVILDWLEELKPATVLFTPDADAHLERQVTAQVRTSLVRMMKRSKEQGFSLEVEVWQMDIPPADRHKGIDDALVAGVAIQRIAPEEYLRRLPLDPAAPTGEPLLTASEPLPQTLEGALKAAARFRDEIKTKDMAMLATMIDAAGRGVQIAPKARKKALGILQRYEAQLGGQGVNVHDVTASEQALRESDESEADKKDPNHQADILLESAAGAQLIKHGAHHYLSMLKTNPDGSFARETVRFNDRGNGVAAWLTYNYYKSKGRAPSSEAIKAAMATLEARCEFEGAQEPVWLRVAETKGDGGDGDRRIFHDLGDSDRKIVVISPSGWQVTQDVPVFFWRPKAMHPVPEPVRGGNIEELRNFINCPDDSSWILVVAFLIYCFIPTTPHPILMLEGEEGSCKTWLARLLRLIVDPNGALTRRPPRNEEDLSLFALNSHLPCIDNVAGIDEWLSDGLCAISTGNGWGRRQKFSDEAESVVNVVRPVIMTGLGGLHGKSDLMDRTIKLLMQRIPPGSRQTEADLAKAFEEARPRILGALYDIVSAGLANRGKVELPSDLPRMSDFARFICECEPALPWKQGQFIEAFRNHRIDQVLSVLESNSLADTIRSLMTFQNRWEGTATQLHDRLSEFRGSRGKIPGPLQLKPAVLKLRPHLRYLGIEVSEHRTKSARTILLEKPVREPSPLSPTEQTPQTMASVGDGLTVTDRHSSCHPTQAAEVRAAGDLF